MCKHSFISMKPFLPNVKSTLTNMFMNAKLKATKENIIMAMCTIM